jgi:hypothetical protein
VSEEEELAARLIRWLEAENARFAAQQDYDVAVAVARMELPEMQRELGIELSCPEWWPS